MCIRDRHNTEHKQNLPLISQNVQIDDRKNKIQEYAQDKGDKLNIDILAGLRVLRGAGDEHNAKKRCQKMCIRDRLLRGQ